VTVDPEGDEYVYEQLAAILREGIRSGRYPAGRMLPSAKSLSQEHGVSVNSVKRATEILKDEGLVRTVIGRGLFVAR
jgi:DNA-binding GntR family transcriptional regulator